jgi:hypothetical protein
MLLTFGEKLNKPHLNFSALGNPANVTGSVAVQNQTLTASDFGSAPPAQQEALLA